VKQLKSGGVLDVTTFETRLPKEDGGSMQAYQTITFTPRTEALRRALQIFGDRQSAADLMFLENWEAQPRPSLAAAFRVHQIRRANPALAAEIRAELAHGRPLSADERAALPLKS
jgi:hypothetical protein